MQNIYLAHHGILGQKWGIRRFQNADGSLTAEGMRRYGTSVTNEAIKKASKASTVDKKRNLESTTFVRTAQSSLKNQAIDSGIKVGEESSKALNKLNGLYNEETLTNYSIRAEIAAYEGDDATLGSIARTGTYGGYKDGGEFQCNAVSLYAYEKGLTKDCQKVIDLAKSEDAKLTECAKNYVDAMTSQYAGTNVSKLNTAETTKTLVNSILGKNNFERFSSHISADVDYEVEQAAKGPWYNEGEKKQVTKALNMADDVISKIGGTKNDNWLAFDEAVSNLGMTDIQYNEMTQSDWDKINKEIKRLNS